MGATTSTTKSAKPLDLFQDILQLGACRQGNHCTTEELSTFHDNVISKFKDIPSLKHCLHYAVLSEKDRNSECHKRLAEYFEIDNKTNFEASCYGAIAELKREKQFKLIVKRDGEKVDLTSQICEGMYNFMIPQEKAKQSEDVAAVPQLIEVSQQQ